MKVSAVVPVYGRGALVRHTVRRLININGVEVVCVGSAGDRKVCEEAGAEFLEHANILSDKWNFGFRHLKKSDPDMVVFMGSSDWICKEWIETLSGYLEEYDMVGLRGFNLCHIASDGDMEFGEWHGYGEHSGRLGEPIGIGRLISRRGLEKLDYMPFEPGKRNSMDWMMYYKLIKNGGRCGVVDGGNLTSLSISTDAWGNLHQFKRNSFYSQLHLKREILGKFPELKILRKEIEEICKNAKSA